MTLLLVMLLVVVDYAQIIAKDVLDGAVIVVSQIIIVMKVIV